MTLKQDARAPDVHPVARPALQRFPTEAVDEQGKIRQRYRYDDMKTLYDQLRALPAAASYLKPGVTFEPLDPIARAMSDNEAAHQLKEAWARLFQSINQTSQPAA